MCFFRSPKMWKSQGERYVMYGGCWSVPSQISEAYPSHIGGMRTGIIMQKDDSVRQHSRAFWLYDATQHPQPPRNEPYPSALLCLPPFSMPDERTLHYAHLRSNRETIVWTCAFSQCMSPPLEMAVSIRNNNVASFCEQCVSWRVFGFHLAVPYRLTINNFPDKHSFLWLSLTFRICVNPTDIPGRGSLNLWSAECQASARDNTGQNIQSAHTQSQDRDSNTWPRRESNPGWNNGILSPRRKKVGKTEI